MHITETVPSLDECFENNDDHKTGTTPPLNLAWGRAEGAEGGWEG